MERITESYAKQHTHTHTHKVESSVFLKSGQGISGVTEPGSTWPTCSVASSRLTNHTTALLVITDMFDLCLTVHVYFTCSVSRIYFFHVLFFSTTITRVFGSLNLFFTMASSWSVDVFARGFHRIPFNLSLNILKQNEYLFEFILYFVLILHHVQRNL